MIRDQWGRDIRVLRTDYDNEGNLVRRSTPDRKAARDYVDKELKGMFLQHAAEKQRGVAKEYGKDSAVWKEREDRGGAGQWLDQYPRDDRHAPRDAYAGSGRSVNERPITPHRAGYADDHNEKLGMGKREWETREEKAVRERKEQRQQAKQETRQMFDRMAAPFRDAGASKNQPLSVQVDTYCQEHALTPKTASALQMLSATDVQAVMRAPMVTWGATGMQGKVVNPDPLVMSRIQKCKSYENCAKAEAEAYKSEIAQRLERGATVSGWGQNQQKRQAQAKDGDTPPRVRMARRLQRGDSGERDKYMEKISKLDTAPWAKHEVAVSAAEKAAAAGGGGGGVSAAVLPASYHHAPPQGFEPVKKGARGPPRDLTGAGGGVYRGQSRGRAGSQKRGRSWSPSEKQPGEGADYTGSIPLRENAGNKRLQMDDEGKVTPFEVNPNVIASVEDVITCADFNQARDCYPDVMYFALKLGPPESVFRDHWSEKSEFHESLRAMVAKACAAAASEQHAAQQAERDQALAASEAIRTERLRQVRIDRAKRQVDEWRPPPVRRQTLFSGTYAGTWIGGARPQPEIPPDTWPNPLPPGVVAPPGHDPKPGDWGCKHCLNYNFANKKLCNTCGVNRPRIIPVQDFPKPKGHQGHTFGYGKYFPDEGDWYDKDEAGEAEPERIPDGAPSDQWRRGWPAKKASKEDTPPKC